MFVEAQKSRECLRDAMLSELFSICLSRERGKAKNATLIRKEDVFAKAAEAVIFR